MAKLNEPVPPPVESVDALKRRFIRQNREIARVNSNQSQRIRNLETEISRLVAENVSLREAAIAAQTDAERWRNTATSIGRREITNLREKLQHKIQEMGELVVELDRIPDRVERKGRRKSRMSGVGQRISATTEQEWRNRLSMREAAIAEQADADGRLPAILEDKQFPRKTLEHTELAALREEAALQLASESPELGPPPVAHFDVPGRSSIDSARASEDETSADDVMHLPLNLERRRKRRTSALMQNIATDGSNEPATEPPAREVPNPSSEVPDEPDSRSAQPLLKYGAKRKLDISELEEPALNTTSGLDDFIFQRRQGDENAGIAVKKASRFIRAPGRENATAVLSEVPSSPAKDARKILAPKSTNSPAKRCVQPSEKPKDNEGEQPRMIAQRPNRHSVVPPRLETAPSLVPSGERVADRVLPPKTPAVLSDDILSPTSTEPPSRPTSQAKEAAVLHSVEDVLNGSIGRGSRRARAAVSYAEPNLRDKMRRPGKELVGAVEGVAAGRGPSVDRSRSEDPTANKEQSWCVKIKEEKDHGKDDRWKQLPMAKKKDPASPLRDKERKERTRLDSRDKIVTLEGSAERLETATEALSIFDPPVSSPLDGTEDAMKNSTRPSTARRTSSARATSDRRHSMQPTSLSSSRVASTDRVTSAPTVQPATQRSATVRAPLPRPSSAASIRSERMASIAKDLKRSNSVSSNLQSREPLPADTGATAQASSRVERTLNRRRSTMV